MGLGKTSVYGMRRGARKLWDFHKFVGFDYFDFPDSDMKTPQYRDAFDDVYKAYRNGLLAAAASDFADIFLKHGSATDNDNAGSEEEIKGGFSMFVDYSLLNALTIKDWSYCRSSDFNEYDPKKSGLRFGQGMAVGAIKNPESAPENMSDAVKSLGGLFPFLSMSIRKFMPWKTSFALGMLFERADERYDNKKSGSTSPVRHVSSAKGFGTFMHSIYEFVEEARKEGANIDAENSSVLKKVYKTAEDFVRKHPYISGTIAAYAAMYARGHYEKNRVTDHFLGRYANNQ